MNEKKQNDFSKTMGAAVESASDFVTNTYYKVDELVMGNDTEHHDMWLYRAMVLAFTPIPYVHFTIKGGVAAVKGVKSLSEYASKKYAKIKEKESEITNKVLSNEELDEWLKKTDEVNKEINRTDQDSNNKTL